MLTFEITTDDDDFDDPDELVYELSLLALDQVPEDEQAQYWTVNGASSVIGTVTDNDLPVMRASALYNQLGQIIGAVEGDITQFRVLRTGQRTGALTVQYEWYELRNPSEGDFTRIIRGTGELNFDPGRLGTGTGIVVPDDGVDEGEGVIGLAVLPDPENYRLHPDYYFAEKHVEDNDPPPTLTASARAVREGSEDPVVRFAVYFARSGNVESNRTVTVDYVTSSGTAIAGEDFVSQSGTLTISPIFDFNAVTVPLLDDRLFELRETFTLTLSNPVNAVLEDGVEELTALGTILDNEPQLEVQPTRSEITEGEDISYTLVRDGDLAEPLTVYLQVGYWRSGDGFIDGGERVIVDIPAGENTTEWTRETEDDEIDEADEVFMAWAPPVGVFSTTGQTRTRLPGETPLSP